jgi:hypothetical protein
MKNRRATAPYHRHSNIGGAQSDDMRQPQRRVDHRSFQALGREELDGNVVRDIFVRFPMWLGYYLESDLKSGKFWAGAQMWVLPPVTAKRRPDCYYEKALPAMARVPFQWRAELSTDGQVCIFTDRCMLGRMDALQYGPAIAETLQRAYARYLAKQPGAAAGAAA